MTKTTSASQFFTRRNCLNIDVSTTGLTGFDDLENTLTKIKFSNSCNTHMDCAVNNEPSRQDLMSIELTFHGDSELLTLADALDFASKELRKHVQGL